MTQNQSNGSVKNAANEIVDYVCKLLIIGNSSVGKTSLLFRYTDDTFSPAFVSTLGVDFKAKNIVRHDKRIKLQIWDTAGQERHRAGTSIYYRGTKSFILMYDITNEESFNAVKDWILQIETHAYGKPTIILIGNKCDMVNERVVPSAHGQKLAEELGLEFFETSAKDNINVQCVFERLADIILEKISKEHEAVINTSQRFPNHINKPGAYTTETSRINVSNNDEQTNERGRRCKC